MHTFNLPLQFVSGLGTICFGLDRILNHNLWIGGFFYLVIGMITIIFAGIPIVKLLKKDFQSND